MATKDRTSLKNDFANGKYATGEKFADLIDLMKVVQLPVVDPQALGTSLSFIDSISQDADGKITATKKTLDLANAHELNPFKGWYKTGDTLPTDGFDGAYLYFKDTTQTPAVTTIYQWNGTAYADTGTEVDESNVNTFGSGQALNAVKIKDENGGEVSGNAGVLSAEAGVELAKTIYGTQSVNLIPLNLRLDTNTELTTSINTGWAVWNNASRPVSVIKETDCFHVEISSTINATYSGFRTDVLPTMITGTSYKASFYAKRAVSSPTFISFYLRTIGGQYELSDIELTDTWVKYTLDFVYSAEQVDRFQFGHPNTSNHFHDAQNFYIKNFSVVKNEENLPGLVDKVNQLSERVEVEGKFAGGQNVNDTSIINDIRTGGATNVLSAEVGKLLGDEVFGDEVANEMPTNQRLDANTTLVSSYSDGWAAWAQNSEERAITVNKVDGYFAVDIDSSTSMVYCGLRTQVLPEMVLGEAYIASFYAKNKDGNTTPIAFYTRTIGGNYELSRIELTDDWVKYELEFVYSPEQVTRFQIGNVALNVYGTAAVSFCVKDFALVKVNDDTKKGLVERVGALEDAMGDVVYKTEALSDLKGKVVAVLGDSISTNGDTGANSNVPEIVIGQNDVGVELSAYLTYYDVQGGLTINGHTFTSDEIGTEVTFTPAIGDVGKVVGKPNNYNPGSLKVWWEVMNEMLGTSVIPVCWSGSSITSHEASNNIYKCSYAWHDSQIRKCGVRVEGSMDRIAPDIIIIYRGTNDFSHVAGFSATYARLTEGYFDAVGFQYPSTDVLADGKWGFKEGLVLTISKLRTAYPHAKIFICTLNVFKRISYAHFPTNNTVNTLPQYNNAIREVADYMGCGVIEFDKDGITFENCYPTYISDSATIPTHPNYKGHLVMGRKAALDMVCQYSDMA